MKIDIKNSTYTKGLVFKDTFYKLELNVELTEEEKAIIKQRKLEDTIIWKLPPPASFPQDDYDGFNLLIVNTVWLFLVSRSILLETLLLQRGF